MMGDHKMLMTDGDGRLGRTVRHWVVGGQPATSMAGCSGRWPVWTDGYDGRLTAGSAGNSPSPKGADLCGATEGDG